jgi:hypothetical protein
MATTDPTLIPPATTPAPAVVPAPTQTTVVVAPAAIPATAPSIVPAVATAAAATAEALVPALLPFGPLISLALMYIKGYFDANGTLPTDASVIAALPVDYTALQQTWASWTPHGS